jgi:hypothetical protein
MEEKVIYTELLSTKHPNVDTLYKIYAENKYHARVYYMNESSGVFSSNRVGIFDNPNGDFSIVSFIKRYGISKTNRIYSRESKVFSIIKKGNKFYYKNKNKILPLTYNNILSLGGGVSETIIIELVKRLPWLRYITENVVCHHVSFNTLFTKKIFSLEKALKFEYKLNGPTSKVLHNSVSDMRKKMIKHYVDYLQNTDSLAHTLPSYDFGIFYDTVKMAKILDKKVNCSWSAKRLKEEHDKWAKEITDIVFVAGDREMYINELFVKFSEFSGFKLLRTTKEMNYEGRKNNHCVATYVSKVDGGNCGIYSIGDYTLELNKEWNHKFDKQYLIIRQFRGYRNEQAPEHLVDMVKNKLKEFTGFPIDEVRDRLTGFNLEEIVVNEVPF